MYSKRSSFIPRLPGDKRKAIQQRLHCLGEVSCLNTWKLIITLVTKQKRHFVQCYLIGFYYRNDFLSVACVAWRFWLGALSNKGGRGRETERRLGRKQLEKPPARTGGFFESVRTPVYGSFRLVRNVRLSIKHFGNLPWESFEGLNKSPPQNKIKISKKRWPERRRSWIFDGKTGTKQA